MHLIAIRPFLLHQQHETNRFRIIYFAFYILIFQKQEKRRELRLKRFWRSPKTTSSEESTGYESPTRTKPASSDAQRFNHLHYTSLSQGSGTTSSSTTAAAAAAANGASSSSSNKPSCSLPLLQVWPSQVGTTNTHARCYRFYLFACVCVFV